MTRPAILIVEPRRDVATALEEVIESANYTPIVTPYLESLSELGFTPAAIVIRIVFDGVLPAHLAIERLPLHRPPIVAIAWDEAEIAEAKRLRCDVILRAPGDVARLCEALNHVLAA